MMIKNKGIRQGRTHTTWSSCWSYEKKILASQNYYLNHQSQTSNICFTQDNLIWEVWGGDMIVIGTRTCWGYIFGLLLDINMKSVVWVSGWIPGTLVCHLGWDWAGKAILNLNNWVLDADTKCYRWTSEYGKGSKDMRNINPRRSSAGECKGDRKRY